MTCDLWAALDSQADLRVQRQQPALCGSAHVPLRCCAPTLCCVPLPQLPCRANHFSLPSAPCGCAETTLAHQLTLGDMHDPWYQLLNEFFQGSTEHVAPWRVQVVQLAMSCLLCRNMLCSSSLPPAWCARRASCSAACLMAAAPAKSASIPQGNMQITHAAAGTPECQAGMCSADVQVSRGLLCVAAALHAVLFLSVLPVSQSALFRCQEFSEALSGQLQSTPILRLPFPQWALPASIFQQRVTIPSQEDAEGFDGPAFTAGGYGW